LFALPLPARTPHSMSCFCCWTPTWRTNIFKVGPMDHCYNHCF
jgi:hypothetical protein